MRVLVSDGSAITNIVVLEDGAALSAGQFAADDYAGAAIGTPIIGSVPSPKPGADYELVDGAWLQVEDFAATMLAAAKEEADASMLSALRRMSTDLSLELLMDSDLQTATATATAAIKATCIAALEAATTRAEVTAALSALTASIAEIKTAVAAADTDALAALAA